MDKDKLDFKIRSSSNDKYLGDTGWELYYLVATLLNLSCHDLNTVSMIHFASLCRNIENPWE